MRNKRNIHNKEFDTDTVVSSIDEYYEEKPLAQPAEDMLSVLSKFSDEVGFDSEEYEPDSSVSLDDTRPDLYEPRPLSPNDDMYEDILENFAYAPTKPKYWFEEFGDYWTCSCGHINTGEICESCGLERDLLRQLFILHKPGDGEYHDPGLQEKKTDGAPAKSSAKEGLSKKQKLIIAIIVVFIAAVVGGLFTYFNIIKPSIEKKNAAQVQSTSDALLLGITESLAETDSFVRKAYILSGDKANDDGKYLTAIEFYYRANDINHSESIDKKILDARYGYVKANESKGGSKFEKYLAILMDANYQGVKDIYDRYYAWHISIVANTADDDISSDSSTFSRTDTVYFHINVSGGPPDGSISLYYEATWPGGNKEVQQLTSWKNGASIPVGFRYPVPMLGKEGTLSIKVFDESTKECLGSHSVTLSK